LRTTSVARVLHGTDGVGEPRIVIGEIYSWFKEGFDTADLKDAKALLDQLNRL
jgi:adenylate cyclase